MTACSTDAAVRVPPLPDFDPSSDPLFALLPEEDRALFRKATVPLVRAGRFLGPSRNTTYKAARIGHIPTIEVCGQKFVSTAWLWETWRNSRAAPIAA